MNKMVMFFIHWRLQGTKIFYHKQISHENIQQCQTTVYDWWTCVEWVYPVCEQLKGMLHMLKMC